MKRKPHLALVVLAFVAACSKAPELSLRPVVNPAVEARALCLADSGAKTPIDRALRAAQQAAATSATKPQAWIAAGREWLRKARLESDPGFYLNVDGCVTVALQLEARFVPALELRGLVLMNQHAFDAARALAEEVLSIEPDNAIASGTLSDALLELGRYDAAAAAAQRHMQAQPGMAANARGSYLSWLHGDTDSAKLFIRAALNHRNSNDPEPAAWVLVEAATIFWHEADYDGADALYAEALKWVPGFPAALLGRARIALGRNQPQQAIELLQRLRPGQALFERAWLLADAYELAGDSERAEHYYAETLRQGRRGDSLGLAQFLLAKNRATDEALRLLIEERRSRGGIYLDDAYAFALYRAGRFADARQASEQALRLGTRDARLLYRAGAIRIAAGERSAGRQLIEQALTLNPQFDVAGSAEARALLARVPDKMDSSDS